MVNIKSLFIAALLSSVAASSFAQAAAGAKVAPKAAPAAATVPADSASTPKNPKVKKHTGMKHKKAVAAQKSDAAKPAVSAAK